MTVHLDTRPCFFIKCRDGPLCVVHLDADPECKPDESP